MIFFVIFVFFVVQKPLRHFDKLSASLGGSKAPWYRRRTPPCHFGLGNKRSGSLQALPEAEREYDFLYPIASKRNLCALVSLWLTVNQTIGKIS
ncbi:MAG: hypothetical protein A2509_04980 [Candidatus Edwardsbacteria bacterium RIFOXYD12_FULL_50_11]|uniref:Uncharacterized protein n=1 Tax=Candidatus Edwardsbacteria bacterium GWF2_54_11 TaxID=1817851 RepID=A0A1F5RHK4_9BACT|nr:MAG: hypothetical protein A2502_01125 [Candidatus Edwardsbacteria bacterium RifOxyC12_full_54_24]OGF06101.1 MAG: hypothetical protein A2273_11055 [Candidatus Edwardsbacteria bacterium RifOxyA12_full_54_48]OGF13832.1 MAG: hypothetical protein A2024_10295 [Candidatus Edwardsbacteria bacterium GWF2_54_11]OGF17841.1 MAG: hypothetical protein A2509_04980 [Candidatus Edwardsbacteria bacterium RIFOXYD12_FULL_50_11]OGJ18997.1 MAG: hypothetical protein A2349_12400 [Candidatus Edwardsbacteria bacteriu